LEKEHVEQWKYLSPYNSLILISNEQALGVQTPTLIQLGGSRFKNFLAISQNPCDLFFPFSYRVLELPQRPPAHAAQHLKFPFRRIGNPFPCLFTRPRRKQSGEPGSDSKAREKDKGRASGTVHEILLLQMNISPWIFWVPPMSLNVGPHEEGTAQVRISWSERVSEPFSESRPSILDTN
jgi:hypothetical protein